jgi:tRNA(Ile)-lysidine synthase
MKHYEQASIPINFELLEENQAKILLKNSQKNVLQNAFNDEKLHDLIFKINSETSDENFSSLVSNLLRDKDKINFPLIIRKWQEGDYFYPSGMTGKKKLSKYFKDEKYSLLDKENQWLLCTDDQIIWVIGKRADQRFLAQKLTVKTIQIVLK